ncbi:MAG: hypothetical protein ACI9QV_001102 [Methylophagaceae bacterium]|jgi:hypothetical protein
MSADTTIQFNGRDQACELALSLIHQAKTRLCFFGSTLDTVLFDHADSIEAISAFSRRVPRAQARFIVQDSQQAHIQSHRLTALSQRLTSSIHLRQTSGTHKDLQQYFLLIDDDAYLQGQHASRYVGRGCFDDRSETRRLQQLFDTIWEQGTPDSMTRRLTL